MTGTITQRLQRLFFVTMLVMLADPAFALGLGEATVRSYLQQPLELHIRLISRSEAELSSVTAKLASAEDFQVIGLSRAGVSVPLEFEVFPDPDAPYIRVSSNLPVTDPVLQIVVEVTWASGRMLRQYTLFLDPPTFASPAPLPAPPRPEPQITAAPEPVVRTVDAAPSEPQTEDPPVIRDRVDPPAPREEPAPAEPLVQDTAPEPEPELTPEALADDASPADAPGDTAADPEAAARRAASIGTGPDFQSQEPEADQAPEEAMDAPAVSEAVAETAPPQDALDELDAAQAMDDPVSDPMDDAMDDAVDVAADDPVDSAMEDLAQAVETPAEAPVETVPESQADAPVDTQQDNLQAPAEDAQVESLAAAEPESVTTESITTEPDATTEPEPAPVEPEPEPAPQQPTRAVAQEQPEAFRAVIPDESSGETVAVQRGDTLWEIANDWRDGRDYSVNQVMLAIQQQNPEAFNRGNINALRSGAILRMPSEPQMGRLSGREAMLEVMRQEDAYRNRWSDLPEPPAIPALAEAAQETEADTGDADPPAEEAMASEAIAEQAAETPADDPLDPADEPASEVVLAAEEAPRLELVPPSVTDAGSGSGLGEGNNGGAGVTEGESVVEELARAREDLVNAQQENEYLADRIAELEAELSRREAEEAPGVADTGLAEMEDRLEAQRQAPDPAEDLPVVPPSEDPWYGRMLWWLAGLLLATVAAVIWWLRSRPTLDEQVEAEMAALAEEANDVIRVLDSGEGEGEAPTQSPDDGPTVVATPAAEHEPDGDDPQPESETDPEPDLEATVVDLRSFKPPVPPPDGEEAVELDSEDPETKLDLARAYLSMGDSDAARRMLEDVINTGSEEQAAEARGMMDEL